MADISSWSPVDASNNASPPNGWPENMLPSAVNDCARAMMGAIRRNYDQTISGSLSLPYLPLAGGTTSGNINSPNFVATAGYYFADVQFAYRLSDAIILNDGAGQLAISLNASGSYYRNNSHTFQNDATTTIATLDGSGNLAVTGQISATNIAASGNVTITGNINGSADITTSGNIYASAYLCDGLVAVNTSSISTPGGPATVPTFCNQGGGAGIKLHNQVAHYLSDSHTFFNAAGSAGAPVNASAFNVISDIRLKADIEPAPEGLPEILKLNPVSFRRLHAQGREVGFVAQDVEAVLPQAVTSFDLNGEATLAVSDMPILAALVNAIKDISKRLESLEAR